MNDHAERSAVPRKVDIGLAALLVNMVVLMGGWLWGIAELRSAVTLNERVTGDLLLVSKELRVSIVDVEARLRVLEDRMGREVYTGRTYGRRED
jgi:hypothetical protein